MGQGCAHGLHGEGAALPYKGGKVRRHEGVLLPELVGICFAQCVLARMKIGRGLLGMQHADIAWQYGIEAVAPVEPGAGIGHIAVYDLPVGVYARIGTARAMRPHGLPGDGAQRRLQLTLNGGRRAGFFLNLPSAVAGSHIGNNKLETHQSGILMRVMSSVNLAVFCGAT